MNERRSNRLSRFEDHLEMDVDLQNALFRRKLYGGSWFAYDYVKNRKEEEHKNEIKEWLI